LPFFDAAEADRHLAHELVVHVQHDRITSGFDVQHRFGEQIAGDAADDVLSPQAAIGALTVTTIAELSSAIVGKDNVLLAVVADDARLWIG
jgi:hypothetical protein